MLIKLIQYLLKYLLPYLEKSTAMDDIFHPDNPKREDRLKNIGAQMDEQVRLLVEDSEEIGALSD